MTNREAYLDDLDELLKEIDQLFERGSYRQDQAGAPGAGTGRRCGRKSQGHYQLHEARLHHR